ncbi:MAG: HD domain-containing protein [Lachnospiraceae bacterium]|nr:HD domain-containing protein [Lachnospiraceae bacterium]
MNKKTHEISFLVIGCILLNYIGKNAALYLELPLWLDSIGTALTAYVLGPVCGAVTGAVVNLIYGFTSPISAVYALTNIAVGIIVGVCARKGFMENLFKVLSTAFLVTMASVFISTPLNIFFFDGAIRNKWGDGIIELLQVLGCNRWISYFMGQFYIDFLDKVVTMLVLFWVIKRYRTRKNYGIKSMLLLFCIGLFIFGTEEVYASDFDSYVQSVYSGENGLLGGTANDIAQTKDGILWIGTYGGLYRYNGRKFQLMDTFESVKNVNCLYTDEEGRLWIGTNDRGVSICINEGISNIVSQEDGLPTDTVRCITKSTQGTYYVGTTGELAVLTLSSGLGVSDTIEEITYANSISADTKDNIATVTNAGGLYLVNGTEVLDKKVQMQKGEMYTCCTFDIMGNLYVGTTNSRIEVYQVEETELKLAEIIECENLVNIKSIYTAEDENVYICADNGVGFIAEDGKFHPINTNNFNSSIDHMLVDYQGNLWFTSSRQGLLCMSESVFGEVYTKAGLTENVVNTVVKWQDKFYFGTDNGLDITDASMKEVLTEEFAEQLEGVRIRCLMVDRRNHLWICTSDIGLLEVDSYGKVRSYSSQEGTLGNKFRSVVELSNGVIAAAGDLGITFIENGKVTHTIGQTDGLENPKVLCLLEQEDGTLLVGTDGNGIACIVEGKVQKILHRANGLGSDVILRMVEDEKTKDVFVVTSNSLSLMEKSGKIRLLENFPYYNNFDVVLWEEDTMFVLGAAGIYVVNKANLLSGKTVDYYLLDSSKGLEQIITPNAWNYVDEKGNLFISGDKGVSYLNLNHYEITTRSYRMLLKNILADDVAYPIDKEVPTVIPRGAKRVEIVPEVVNYSLNNPYVSVYLEGFENEPSVMRQNELSGIVYTNLPTGEYVFHLAILDSKTGKEMVKSSYPIIKEKEIYDYWWFRVYAVFVLVLAVMYLSWLFTRTQIQKTLDLQKKELELAQSQLRMGNETILTIAKTVDAKDENTSQHSIRVSEYSVMIARKLGFSEEECEALRKTALLHDIGKIGIPDSVLNKPARLTDEEYGIMKSHVVRGAEILKNFTLIENVVEGALYHHERYDGRGYIHGLKGEEIPLNARIIGIADAFDAMTANRVYRKKLDLDFVLEELKKGKGTQFDPEIVDIMLGLIEDGTIDVNRLYEAKGGIS